MGISIHTGWGACVDKVLASHPRIHTAEGYFYRDVVRDACPFPVKVIPPASLDPSKLGKLDARAKSSVTVLKSPVENSVVIRRHPNVAHRL
jgi:hypothetical protein